MNHYPLPTAEQPTESFLNGTWEQSGRSPNTAALLGLLGIGALYFNASSILSVIVLFGVMATSGGPDLSGNFLERLSAIMKYYADPFRAVVLISQYAFLLLPALWLVKRWHSTEVRTYIRLKGSPVAEILLAVLTTLALIPAGNYIADFLSRLLPIPEKLIEISAEIFTARSLGEFIWLTIVICVTPAICEEIFFRGFVQRTFERTMMWKSVILTGVLFGLFHFQPLGLVTLALMGVLFGYFYYRSKSLFPSMAAHFVNNFTAIYFLYQTPEMQETGASAAADKIPLWLVAATLPVGIGLLYLFHKITSKHALVGASDNR